MLPANQRVVIVTRDSPAPHLCRGGDSHPLRRRHLARVRASAVAPTKRELSAIPVAFILVAEPNSLPMSNATMRQDHARTLQRKPLAPDSAESLERQTDTAIVVVLTIVAHLTAAPTNALEYPCLKNQQPSLAPSTAISIHSSTCNRQELKPLHTPPPVAAQTAVYTLSSTMT